VDAKIKQLSHKITTRFNDRLLYQRLDGIWRNGKFLIMELELVEPDLYLNFSKQALNQWVGILERILNKN
jgi:formamidopyrimidine-DNA glycosylase